MSTKLQGRLAIFLVTVLFSAPFAIGVLVFASPLLDATPASDDWLPIAPLASLPDDDMPRRFVYYREHRDAWMRHPNQPAGYVFLRRAPGGNEVLALSASHHAKYRVPLRFDRDRGVFESLCWLDHTYSLTGRYLGTMPDEVDLPRYDVRVADGYICVRGLGK